MSIFSVNGNRISLSDAGTLGVNKTASNDSPYKLDVGGNANFDGHINVVGDIKVTGKVAGIDVPSLASKDADLDRIINALANQFQENLNSVVSQVNSKFDTMTSQVNHAFENVHLELHQNEKEDKQTNNGLTAVVLGLVVALCLYLYWRKH